MHSKLTIAVATVAAGLTLAGCARGQRLDAYRADPAPLSLAPAAAPATPDAPPVPAGS